MAYNGYFSLTNSVGAWLPRISQKLQKQNELPIVDLKKQDMRISFCKKGRNGITHMLWLENPRLEHNFGEKIQILTSSCAQKSKFTFFPLG